MSLQFSKLNFKAKHQASTNQIFDPYVPNFQQRDRIEQIEKEKNDRIMEIFNNLPLDDDELNFVNSSDVHRNNNEDLKFNNSFKQD